MYYGEKFNSITSLVGAVLALMGFGALLAVGIMLKEPLVIVSFFIYGFTLILLYVISTLYHSFRPPKFKKLFQKFDHIVIYILIAGTYTPYMLVSLGEGNGPLLLVFVWALAVLGILLEIVIPNRIEWMQIIIYLVMGWVCLIEFSNLQTALPLWGIVWLIVGGIAYTTGVILYTLDGMNKLRHAHGIWHIFVLAGSVSHFISIIAYVR